MNVCWDMIDRYASEDDDSRPARFAAGALLKIFWIGAINDAPSDLLGGRGGGMAWPKTGATGAS